MSSLGLLSTGDGTAVLRRATADDVATIVELLADDPLGAARERAGAEWTGPYREAFRLIDADPAHLLVVVEIAGSVVGTLHLTFLPGLARRGALRAQIEAVRVRADHRRTGLGGQMLAWAVDEARRRGCGLVQLTSDKQRPEAHRLYSRLGFVASHEGFKLVF